MNRWALVLWVPFVAATSALAEEACRTQQLKNQAPTRAEIYAMAARHATWYINYSKDDTSGGCR